MKKLMSSLLVTCMMLAGLSGCDNAITEDEMCHSYLVAALDAITANDADAVLEMFATDYRLEGIRETVLEFHKTWPGAYSEIEQENYSINTGLVDGVPYKLIQCEYRVVTEEGDYLATVARIETGEASGLCGFRFGKLKSE